jgi:hypothetical protein
VLLPRLWSSYLCLLSSLDYRYEPSGLALALLSNFTCHYFSPHSSILIGSALEFA